MPIKAAPLNIETIASLPAGPGAYVLRHDPTGAVLFGSSINMRERLRQWHYQISNPDTRTVLPRKVKATLAAHGHNVLDWSCAILLTALPASYKPKTAVQLKPEWPYIKRMSEQYPARLLNAIPAAPAVARALRQHGTKGISPLRYLKARLGKGAERFSHGQPAHNWPIDARPLGSQQACPERSRGARSSAPTATPLNVPFAVYLHRSMEAGKPRHYNPSPAAIEALFRHWLRYVPRHEKAHTIKVPSSINDALAVPVPRGYA